MTCELGRAAPPLEGAPSRPWIGARFRDAAPVHMSSIAAEEGESVGVQTEESAEGSRDGSGLALVVRSILIAVLICTSLAHPAIGQSSDDATPGVTDVAADPGDATLVDAEPAAIDLADEPEPVAPESPVTEETTAPPPDEAPEEPADQPEPEPEQNAPVLLPALAYFPEPQPVCVPSNSLPETIPSGGSLAYDCLAGVSIRASDLDPAAIVVTWRITASTAGDWIVALRPAPAHDHPDPQWTSETTEPALLTLDVSLNGIAPAPTIETFHQVAFQLQMTRPACALDLATALLSAEPSVLTPTAADTVIERVDQDADIAPLQIAPAPAPVATPAITVDGTLDFGDVAIDATGVTEPPAPQAITVTITQLNEACGEWTLILFAPTPTHEDDSEPTAPIAGLMVVSVDTAALPDGGCALEKGCAVTTIATGPDAPERITVTLGIALVLPDRPAISAYSTALAIALEAGIPESGTLTAAIAASGGTTP